MATNPIKLLQKMKDTLPPGFEINEKLSLKSDSVWASHHGLVPPLVWRGGKWKSTTF